MFIHFTPRIFELPTKRLENERQNEMLWITFWPATLISVEIPEFDLVLVGGKDVVKRKPYPNKGHSVVCRKIGRKAILGILLDVPYRVREFTTKTHWEILMLKPEFLKNNEEDVFLKYNIFHFVKYIILDQKFDLVTDNTRLWSEKTKQFCTFESRRPKYSKKLTPLEVYPYYDILLNENKINDENFYYHKLIHGKKDILKVPSVEADRLIKYASVYGEDRMPTIEMALKI
jgi:hypothetical protein